MPIAVLSLPDVHETVARPAILQIASQVLQNTGIPDSVRIYYKGKSSSVATPGTQLDTPGDNGRQAQMENRRRVIVEANEEYSLDDISRIRSHKNDTVCIFMDAATGVYIRPIYVTASVTLNIKFRTHSETDARRWISDMMVRTDRGRVINIHSVAYQYPLEASVVELITEVYQRRETVQPYGMSFAQYIQKHASSRLTMLSNRTDFEDQLHTLSIRERQGRIQGSYEFIGTASEPAKDNSTGMWEIGFDYVFKYQRPEQIQVEYPIVVHNRVLPAKFTGEEDVPEEQEAYQSYHSNDMALMSQFEALRDVSTRRTRPYPNAPHWDHYRPSQYPQGTASLFQALVTPNEDDFKTILDLNDLGDYAIDQDILEFFVESEGPYLTEPYKSFYHLTVYQNEEIAQGSSFEIKSPITLSAKTTLDLRKVHRVRLGIVYDLSLLDPDALRRLKLYPEAMLKTVRAIYDAIRVNPDFQPDLSGSNHRFKPWGPWPGYWHGRDSIEPWEMDQIWTTIRGGVSSKDYPVIDMDSIIRNKPPHLSLEDWLALLQGKGQMRSVQTSWLVARRHETM